jgi:crotonobetainyl-CoA:carnitine CoA-transferase CaiB-like acyl-CoA transferase
LFDAMSEWMSYPAYYTRDGGRPLARTGARHATIAPYGPFATGDGKTVFFGIQNEREWASFCGIVLGDPAIAADPRFASNPARMAHRDDLQATIEAKFSAWTSAEVLAKLDAAAIANARLNDVTEFLAHPQLHQRNRIRSIGSETGPQDVFLPAVTIPGLEPAMNPVPALGQHTASILAELGLNPQDS